MTQTNYKYLAMKQEQKKISFIIIEEIGLTNKIFGFDYNDNVKDIKKTTEYEIMLDKRVEIIKYVKSELTYQDNIIFVEFNYNEYYDTEITFFIFNEFNQKIIIEEPLDFEEKFVKLCAKCKDKKIILNFHSNIKSSDGFHCYCKDCRKGYSKPYYENNKEKYKENTRRFLKKNSNYSNEYYHKNKDNVNFKLKMNLRSRLYSMIQEKKIEKIGSHIEDLGCSISDLKKHLENQFDNLMNWDNYGIYWNIDHSFPLSKLNLSKKKHFLLAVNFKNLAPMIIEENIAKSNQIFKEIEYVRYVLKELQI